MRQNLLQSVTGIAKCDRRLTQTVRSTANCVNHYKVRRNKVCAEHENRSLQKTDFLAKFSSSFLLAEV